MNRFAAVALIAVALGGIASLTAQDASFPHTKKVGRATIEFKDDDGLHVVASYDYSQRNHDKPWLLIDIAFSSKPRLVLNRSNIRLVTPDGRELRVATQESLIADSASITQLLQNAKVLRNPLESYFSQRGTIERLRFYSFPGKGLAFDEAIVDNDRVTSGELLFKTPEGSWKEGTYRLVIDNEKAKAALPILLQ